MMVEHGTAAIKEDLEAAIGEVTGGQVTVGRSGIERASAIAGGYGGAGKGNFRFKAALESLGNLIHNATAGRLDFPGQTGMNSRTAAPEEMGQRERSFTALQKVLCALPPELRRQLSLPYLEVTSACDLVHEVMERINQRTEHALEGWESAGLTTVDYEVPGVGRLSQDKVLALDLARRSAVLAVAAPVARRLSPREVFQGGKSELAKLRPEQAAALLAERHGREVVVKGGLIEFCDRAVSPDMLRYIAHTRSEGDKFRAVVNPFSAHTLHLFDAAGRWCGTCESWGAVPRTDTEALERRMGEAAHVERQWLDRLAPRAGAITRARTAAAEQNARVLQRAVEKPELAELLSQSGL